MAVAAFAQASSGDQETDPERWTTERYEIVFREIYRYQAQADLLRSQGKSDTFVRNHHRRALELTAARSEVLVTLSRQYVQEVSLLDKAAREMIRAAKKTYRPAQGARGPAVPPPPSALLDLQTKRDQTTKDYIARLAESFGPSAFRYFDALVRRYIAAGYRVSSSGKKEVAR